MKVTVLGTGGWGLTLGQVVYENKNELTFWTNSQAEVDLLSTEHQYKAMIWRSPRGLPRRTCLDPLWRSVT